MKKFIFLIVVIIEFCFGMYLGQYIMNTSNKEFKQELNTIKEFKEGNCTNSNNIILQIR